MHGERMEYPEFLESINKYYARAGMSLGRFACAGAAHPIAAHRQIASGASYAAIAGALVYSLYKAAAKSRVGMNRHSER